MPAHDLARRAARGTAGLAVGGATALVELGFLLVGGAALAVRPARGAVFAVAVRLAEVERRRLARFFGSENATDHAGARAMRYLVPRCVLGLAALGIFFLILWGLASGVVLVVRFAGGDPIGVSADRSWYDLPAMAVFGLLLLFLAVQGLLGLATLDIKAAHRFLGPSERELLRRRVSELATTRAGVVDAVNDERRRIERDLHDGVQQTLVSLGMLLGRARRGTDPDRLDDLLAQAHEQSQYALRELRDVTWRVYPTALDDGGLHPALESVAERSSVPVTLRYALTERLDRATETVAYFVVSEAVTNATKHATPSRIEVDVDTDGTGIMVRVWDDGAGGARPDGSGLTGLARRVAAADGEFTVDSPVGGPTVVAARLPCG
jgi:signal transduction histidine kinase